MLSTNGSRTQRRPHRSESSKSSRSTPGTVILTWKTHRLRNAGPVPASKPPGGKHSSRPPSTRSPQRTCDFAAKVATTLHPAGHTGMGHSFVTCENSSGAGVRFLGAASRFLHRSWPSGPGLHNSWPGGPALCSRAGAGMLTAAVVRSRRLPRAGATYGDVGVTCRAHVAAGMHACRCRIRLGEAEPERMFCVRSRADQARSVPTLVRRPCAERGGRFVSHSVGH